MHQTANRFGKETNPTAPCPKFPHGHELQSRPRYVSILPFWRDDPEPGFETACQPARVPPASSTASKNFEPELALSKCWPSSLQRLRNRPSNTKTNTPRCQGPERTHPDRHHENHLEAGGGSQAAACHPPCDQMFPSVPSGRLNHSMIHRFWCKPTRLPTSPHKPPLPSQFSLLKSPVKRSPPFVAHQRARYPAQTYMGDWIFRFLNFSKSHFSADRIRHSACLLRRQNAPHWLLTSRRNLLLLNTLHQLTANYLQQFEPSGRYQIPRLCCLSTRPKNRRLWAALRDRTSCCVAAIDGRSSRVGKRWELASGVHSRMACHHVAVSGLR